MFEAFKKSRGILGMNARNLDYIRPYNRKKGKRISDDKILCKRVLKKNGLPTSRLIAKISTIEQLEHFDWSTLPSSFALKPNRGFGGEGIVVVYGKKKNRENTWVKANGSPVTLSDIQAHIRNILDGSFSLSNTPDIAFFEERLTLLKLFKPYAYKGIPDIRVIVFNSIPVMAMLRLPTKESGGKANLQQGAIGLGIDLASGTTTTAVLGKGKIVEYAPGTRLALSGIKIPYWKDILTMAVKAQQVSGLGFLGADIAIDRELGPAFLELNARPGLSIQLANLDGLKNRLERVKGLRVKSVLRGVRMGMDLFGGEIQEELEEISGKKVIGTVAKARLIGIDGKSIEVNAKIDTGADSTAIDLGIARELGFDKTVDEYLRASKEWSELSELSKKDRWKMFEHIPHVISTVPVKSSHGVTYRIIVRIQIELDGITIPAKVTLINRSHLEYPVIVGKRNLRKFLIDVNK
ncbi:MAG: sugar-transfer associated ATP-grasp domain-containing protein [Candidatus Moranbacteria bacterium]|nr:sugar-transfer associated ATP-grasp domain-containing protein [Candidatus Moranbacteria bacterium]